MHSWADLHGRECDAGIFVPIGLETEVKDEAGGRDWLGLQIGKRTFISAHALDIQKAHVEDNRHEVMREEIERFIGRRRNERITIGIDANTTVRKADGHRTGNTVNSPLISHNNLSRDRIMELMEQDGLQALQTKGKEKTDEERWARREADKMSTIYYMFNLEEEEGEGWVWATTDESLQHRSTRR